ncbi:MAG: peptidoglycan DD-metalloendopeptidase family protein [Desulfobulbaceae bacterium]|nr:peptidoglycan DD-metalloendopeptidase family protein [Desulfobulbaceae bacterium]
MRHLLRTSLLSLFVVMLLLTPASSPATPEDLDKPIAKFKINIGQLREEIKNHLEKIKESGKMEMDVLDELHQLDEHLQQQKHKIETLQDRLQSQQHLLQIKTKDMEQARLVKENVRKHLQKRLRSFYLMGKTGFLNVAFSTDNLPNLMIFNDSFIRLLNYDQSVVDMYRNTLQTLESSKYTLELEEDLLHNFITQSHEEEQKLNSLKAEKKELLNRIKQQKMLYEQAVKEMKKAEGELTSVLVSLKEKKHEQDKGFMRAKGTLPKPVDGFLLRKFKQSGEQEGLLSTSINGITIETGESASVKAVYDGKVIFAGYMRGYGNTIIIEHGLRYFTVTARLETIKKAEGDVVSGGEQIGSAGGIASLLEKGLYFEIRHGAEPLDPLLWLAPQSYEESGQSPGASAKNPAGQG